MSAILGAAVPQAAPVESQPAVATDPRIQAVPFDSDAVVELRVANGFAAIVEFAPDERVETIVVGDEASWDVAPNRLGNRVVVKPLAAASPTDMVVVTDARRYVFQITTDRGGDVFVLRFTYPDPPKQETEVAEYRMRGDKALYPVAMYDDGRRTTISWDRRASLPAVFAIDDHGRESLVNGRMTEGGYIIQGVAGRYVFRLDGARATATRRLPKPTR